MKKYVVVTIYKDSLVQFLYNSYFVFIQTRQKVLSSAFVRAMKDPFPPARGAGVLSMMSAQKYFSLRDTAFKVLPTLCTLTVDPDKGVRDQTFKAIKAFLDRQERVSENPEMAAEIGKIRSGREREGGGAGEVT